MKMPRLSVLCSSGLACAADDEYAVRYYATVPVYLTSRLLAEDGVWRVYGSQDVNATMERTRSVITWFPN